MAYEKEIEALVILDVETGGFDPKKNPITQIAYEIISLDKFETIAKYNSFVQPYENLVLEEQAMVKTGIKYEDLIQGKTIQQVCQDLITDLKSAAPSFRKKPIIVGHNIPFDISFLEMMFKICKKDIGTVLANSNGIISHLDTMQMSKLKWVNEKDMKFNLESCCSKAGIEIFDAHNAENDILATKQLLVYHINTMRANEAVQSELKEDRFRDHFQF